jgi:hypothetical protein
VEDQGVGGERPLRRRHSGAQLLLDNLRIVRSRDADPVRYPKHVSVDGKAGHSECMPEDDIRSLAADARQFNELGHRRRHLPAVALDAGGRHSQKGSGLRTKEPSRLDLGLEFVSCRPGENVGVGIPLEERGRDLIHALIGALCGEDRRNEQLVCVRKVQLRIGVRVLRPELRHDAPGIGGGFRRRRRPLAAGSVSRHSADSTAGVE